ncbi:hypothetical protein K443DRAFT_680667 [Laccaria amethystina LaAM-08-1]|uniref:Uncharacterized protein n=1 Tax=Laccaria amethystina LaAM-08-1 TaxID=1095629 RepID=A0A0C9XRJ4_9AGAR|nr:hypothetical protein K443DRAFT_680667 [Laccaria amethystina LaAM-08-1]
MGSDQYHGPPSTTTLPRPVLKHFPDASNYYASSASSPLPFAFCSLVLDSPHVHFPPTPTMTCTELTHSPYVYDRAPINVSLNTCELPERGGRVYDEGRLPPLRGRDSGYFHPRPRSDDVHSRFNDYHDAASVIYDSPPSDASPPPQMSVPPLPEGLALYPMTIPDNTQTGPLCSPSLAKTKHGKKARKKGDSKTRSVCSAFSEPALDGCLGGF